MSTLHILVDIFQQEVDLGFVDVISTEAPSNDTSTTDVGDNPTNLDKGQESVTKGDEEEGVWALGQRCLFQQPPLAHSHIDHPPLKRILRSLVVIVPSLDKGGGRR